MKEDPELHNSREEELKQLLETSRAGYKQAHKELNKDLQKTNEKALRAVERDFDRIRKKHEEEDKANSQAKSTTPPIPPLLED